MDRIYYDDGPVVSRRWRLESKNLKGCPYRQDRDDSGHMKRVACADLKGTVDTCRECKHK